MTMSVERVTEEMRALLQEEKRLDARRHDLDKELEAVMADRSGVADRLREAQDELFRILGE